MRAVIFVFLTFLCACKVSGVDYVLEGEYSFKEEEVYARDLFPEFQEDFLLFRIPRGSQSYQVKSSQIIRDFENKGFLVLAESPIITFRRTFGGEHNGIKGYIVAEFLREYARNKIQIQAIHLEQITPVSFKENAIRSINFPVKLLKRNTGSFDVVIIEQVGKQIRNRKVYFKYILDAKLQAIESNQSISGGVSVGYDNARVVWIPLEQMRAGLMTQDDMGEVAVRSYVPKGVILTKDRLVPKRVVKKGDRILVSVLENGVLLEFILEAQKDAAIGDVITGRALEGKKTYAIEITQDGRGKLL